MTVELSQDAQRLIQRIRDAEVGIKKFAASESNSREARLELQRELGRCREELNKVARKEFPEILDAILDKS